MLLDECLSELGKTEARELRFSADGGEVSVWLRQTEEFRQIVLFEDHFPSQDYYDLTPALGQIRIPGTYLEPHSLSELRLSLLTIASILAFLGKNSERFPALHALSTGFTEGSDVQGMIGSLTKLIFTVIDERSQVRSSASPELGEIRRNMDRMKSQIEKKILQIYRNARKNGWTPEDSEVTVRDGQLVIPMISTHKRKISGFVRDESATGHTVYLEPAEMLEMNNELRELGMAEHREIVRILTMVADHIRPDLADLLTAYRFLGRIDFIRAKARFAVKIGAVLPLILPRLDSSGGRRFILCFI